MAQVTDPVCGMTIDSNLAAGRSNYEGQTYYFCSTQCLRQFEQNPGKYVGNAAPSRRAEGNSETRA